jgi:hypothetical protein
MAGLDVVEWARCQRILCGEAARTEELARLQGYSLERIRAKDRIAAELAAGRLTLPEAARRFSELPNAPAPLRAQLLAEFEGKSEEECMCRHVIFWACEVIPHQPGETEALHARLEDELAAHLRRLQGTSQ